MCFLLCHFISILGKKVIYVYIIFIYNNLYEKERDSQKNTERKTEREWIHMTSHLIGDHQIILGVICTSVLLQVKKFATFSSCSATHILSESLCVHMINILDKLNVRFLNVQAKPLTSK